MVLFISLCNFLIFHQFFCLKWVYFYTNPDVWYCLVLSINYVWQNIEGLAHWFQSWETLETKIFELMDKFNSRTKSITSRHAIIFMNFKDGPRYHRSLFISLWYSFRERGYTNSLLPTKDITLQLYSFDHLQNWLGKTSVPVWPLQPFLSSVKLRQVMGVSNNRTCNQYSDYSSTTIQITMTII